VVAEAAAAAAAAAAVAAGKGKGGEGGEGGEDATPPQMFNPPMVHAVAMAGEAGGY